MNNILAPDGTLSLSDLKSRRQALIKQIKYFDDAIEALENLEKLGLVQSAANDAPAGADEVDKNDSNNSYASDIQNKSVTEEKKEKATKVAKIYVSPLGGALMKPNPDNNPPAIPERRNKYRQTGLSSELHLADIQKAHDDGESNGKIAARYSVSDESIANFLRKYGRYAPKSGVKKYPDKKEVVIRAPGNKSKDLRKKTEKDYEGEKTDILGEPLIDVRLVQVSTDEEPKPELKKKLEIKPCDIRVSGQEFTGGELVDIYDMLSAGKTTEEIAVFYKKTKKELEDFILRHRNVQITKCAPAYNPMLVSHRTVLGGSRPKLP